MAPVSLAMPQVLLASSGHNWYRLKLPSGTLPASVTKLMLPVAAFDGMRTCSLSLASGVWLAASALFAKRIFEVEPPRFAPYAVNSTPAAADCGATELTLGSGKKSVALVASPPFVPTLMRPLTALNGTATVSLPSAGEPLREST